LRLGGAQEYFGVAPDLAVFGKAIGGGYPLSCVVGRDEVVSAATVASGTFAANALCVTAALATIAEFKKPGFYDFLENLSSMITNGIEEICNSLDIKVTTRAIGGLWTIVLGTDQPLKDYRDHFSKVDKEMYRRLVQGCFEHGIRLNPWRGRNYVCAQSTEKDVRYTLEVFAKLLSQIKQ
jgi:glutamate-1-semialdehyde 2,1-aminomutase